MSEASDAFVKTPAFIGKSGVLGGLTYAPLRLSEEIPQVIQFAKAMVLLLAIEHLGLP